MNAYCNYEGIGLIPWSPLAGGALARPLTVDTTRSDADKANPDAQRLSLVDEEIVRRVEKVAIQKGWKMAGSPCLG